MAKHNIPHEANASVSMLYVDTNFTHLCSEEVRNAGGMMLYKDWYNFYIDEHARFSGDKDWIRDLMEIKFYNIFQGSGDVKICALEEREQHQVLN